MQFIVLDLEWNQPVSYQSSAYRKVGDSLLFEVIQIGAAKLNERLEIVDTISVPICPTHYMTIHPRVKRMTGLNMDVLADAPNFPEGMEQFHQWCGEDCVFVTWGCDDVSVLQQNVDFFRFDKPLPKMYDLQRLYAAAMKLSGQTALKTAMEALEIQPEEDRAFHNAEHDAYYTALVMRKLPDPLAVLGYDPPCNYSGRSPLEALSVGVSMKDTDVVFRCNIVTVTEDEPYAEKTILDHSSGEISTQSPGPAITRLTRAFSGS